MNKAVHSFWKLSYDMVQTCFLRRMDMGCFRNSCGLSNCRNWCRGGSGNCGWNNRGCCQSSSSCGQCGSGCGQSSGGDYRNGYEAGYYDGYQAGYNAGYSEGYQAGYYAGYNDGYQAGYYAGYNDGYQAGGQGSCGSQGACGGQVPQGCTCVPVSCGEC